LYSEPDEHVKKQVENLVYNLQDAWLNNRPDELEQFYHPNVVLLPPGGGEPVEGREAVIESYARFLQAANVNRFEITGLQVDLFDATALATVRFEIDYSMEKETRREQGIEILVLKRSNESWVIIWRTQIPRGTTTG